MFDKLFKEIEKLYYMPHKEEVNNFLKNFSHDVSIKFAKCLISLYNELSRRFPNAKLNLIFFNKFSNELLIIVEVKDIQSDLELDESLQEIYYCYELINSKCPDIRPFLGIDWDMPGVWSEKE